MDRVVQDGSHEWFVGGRTLILKRAFVDNVKGAAAQGPRSREVRRGPRIVVLCPAEQLTGALDQRPPPLLRGPLLRGR
jgi:putative redox protein